MPRPVQSNRVQLPQSTADAQRLMGHLAAGRVPRDHAKAIRGELQKLPANLFGNPQVMTELQKLLRKVAEGGASIQAMAFGWTRELFEGTASIVRGRGTIRGPVPPSLEKLNKTGVSAAGVVNLDPKPSGSPSVDRARVYAAQKKAIDSIGGFDFLSQPPKGKTSNEHTVLVKPGVNWGINGYPTCTSPESTYATVKQTLEEGQARGAKLRVIVGDESGIECKSWGGTTMGNFEASGTLDGAIRAGLEFAVAQEAKGKREFTGAKATLASLVDSSGKERKVSLKDTAAIAMAKKAGVELMGFEEGQYVRVPVPDIAPGQPGNRHFPDGVLIPKVVAEEVTDIINAPKPPGRHALMGCAGLSGALKNHIGLLAGSDRVPMLHGPLDRVPGLNAGTQGGTWVAQFKELSERLNDPTLSRDDRAAILQKLQGSANWDLNNENGPNMMLHEKIAELSTVFGDKERFTITDMRKTLSSVGPDIGDQIDVGKIIATKDAATTDIIANSALRKAYDDLPPPKLSALKLDLPNVFKEPPSDWLRHAVPEGNTPIESFYGRTWLEKGATAFDTLQIRAAMAYGISPLDPKMIEFTVADSKDDAAFGSIRKP